MRDAVLQRAWRGAVLGELVENVNDYYDRNSSVVERYVAGEHIDEGSLAVRRWGVTTDDLFPPTFNRRFRSGDLLFHSRNLNKLVCPDFDGITGEKLFVLRVRRSDLVLPALLPFLLQTNHFVEYVSRMWAGSTNKFLNQTPLMRYEFALPPLEEQRRIVEVLTAAHDHLLAATDLRRATRRLLQSLQKRYFIEAPEGVELAIGEFADVRNGTTPRRNRQDYWGGQVPWLPTGKVNERRIGSADEFITEKALDECSLSIIPRGATLVAMVGEGQTRGRAAFLETDACINQNFGAVVPNATVDPAFVFFLLESQYEALRHWSQGTNQHALNCSLIRSFRVRMPGLERQRELARLLTEVDSAAEHAAGRASEARVLFNMISGRALGVKAA